MASDTPNLNTGILIRLAGNLNDIRVPKENEGYQTNTTSSYAVLCCANSWEGA